MRHRLIAALAAIAVLAGPPMHSAQALVGCDFKLGFRAVRDMILASEGRDVVGGCLEDERFEPSTGNSQQRTAGGLLVWRKADNWTAFTDGATTWLNGPEGLASRPNVGPPFAWEAAAPVGAPVASIQPSAVQTVPSARLPRLPAHRYLLGAHELKNVKVTEGNNEFKELPDASFASRSFVGPSFGLLFIVFVHDTEQGASGWLWNTGDAFKRDHECGALKVEQVLNPDEGWICLKDISATEASVVFGVRVKNRAATVLAAGPASTNLVDLARASVLFQVSRLKALEP